MKDQNRIWRLMGKKLSGEASDEDLKELEKLIKDNPDLTYQLQVITDYWKAKQQKPEATDDPLLKRIQHRIKNQGGAPSLLDRPIVKKKSLIDRGTEALVSFAKRSSLLSNYFKLSWRTLMKNKAFSFINVSGLAVGMASAVIIWLWIQNELSTDQFHSKKDRIYLLLNRGKFEDQTAVWASMPQPLAPTLKKEFPEQVEEVSRSGWVAVFVLKNQDKVVQTQGLMVDSTFLDIFDFPLVAGNYKTALNDPRSIIITEGLAQALFGKEEALNKTIRIDSTENFTVTGIVKNLPNNTSFSFDYLMPWRYRDKLGWNDSNWNNNSILTYVLLKPGVSEETANTLFRDVKKKHGKGVVDELFLFSVKDWWLRDDFDDRTGEIAGGRIDLVHLFSIIVAFILIIACINYMNLSTARSEKRAREVGIRKVMGAHKASLIARFLGESVLISLIAGIIALVLVQLSLSAFANILTLPGVVGINSEKKLFIPYGSPGFWLAAIGFIFFTGILAGIYPAFYLSGYRPISVLQKTYKKIKSFFTFRKVLVVFQFSFAVILIISTIIIYRQIAFGKKRDPGYKQDDLAFVYVKGDMRKNYELIKNELYAQNLATDVTRTNSPVTDVWIDNDDYKWKGMDTSLRMGFSLFEGEDRVMEFHGLRRIAGRDFNKAAYPSDSMGLILTESAVKRMGLKDPVGEIITNDKGTWHVVGVIKDFIPERPFNPPYPIIIHYGLTGYGVINFRQNPALSKKEARDKIIAVFKKYSPGYPIEYRRIDEEYANKFEGEEREAKLAAFFASLTIFISCLGLFALAAYTAEARIKEIGIRKVLGASVSTITALLSKDFLKLVMIAFLIGSPIAWWAMSHWLRNYPYRVEISWWIFALTGLLSLFIAFASVGYQSIKAALKNPVKSLKTE